MKYPFSYGVKLWFSDEEREFTEGGIGFCTNYANAAAQIETFYEEELIEITSIILYEETNLITMSLDKLETVKNEMSY